MSFLAKNCILIKELLYEILDSQIQSNFYETKLKDFVILNKGTFREHLNVIKGTFVPLMYCLLFYPNKQNFVLYGSYNILNDSYKSTKHMVETM